MSSTRLAMANPSATGWWSIIAILVGVALVINFASIGIVNTDATLTASYESATLSVVNSSLGISVIVVAATFAYSVWLATYYTKTRSLAFGKRKY